MSNTKWMIRAHEFVNCSCAYGCPCQFNALPTHGHCHAVVGIQIREGFHGTTKLDGLRAAAMLAWPEAIHRGHGEAAIVIDRHANEAQRDALIRILSGQDTDPGATIFAVFATTYEKVHDPIFAHIDFEVDIEKRRARLSVAGHIDARGQPILNPVTGNEHRMRFDSPSGFEFRLAEAGRGWTSTNGPLRLDLSNSHAHFAELNLTHNGVIN